MPSFRVLIIERDTREAAELRAQLEDWEYTSSSVAASPAETCTVDDAGLALAIYQDYQPSLVIFGPCASKTAEKVQLRQLRQYSGIEPVPILFVLDQKEASGSPNIDGCDDILVRPYSPPLVQLKLASIRRFCEFGRSLMAQRDRMRRHHADFLQEQANAREIFGNLGNESCLDDTPAIRYHLSPRAVLNGDVLAATHAPDGKLVLMLGDFAGHGLAAAVGAVPLTSIFYSMIPRGFSFTRVLKEINRKLHDILPRQMFCCLAMLELDPRRNHLRLLNAGMPSPCVKSSDGKLRLLESRHLPFGVLAADQIDSAVVNLRVYPGDRLFLWSDGIHEARNKCGEHFGESRLLELVQDGDHSGESAFERILIAVNAHASQQHDDLSLVEMDLAHGSLLRPRCEEMENNGNRKGGRVGEWSINLRLADSELRSGDPLPHLLGVLAQMPGAARFQEELAISLGELFRNALEHGVLGLDSSLKCTDEGFVHYYDLMAERRSGLSHGWIEISLRCRDRGRGGELQLEVEDSGPGFPHVSEQKGVYSGRGLSLLKTICRELETRPGSSRVRAVIEWGSGVAPGQAGEAPGEKTVQTRPRSV
ncbi:fused response regulator/phosphatase [uncultured Microbulbifer sp.]|uniref:ATP-binding SpoIIE family protein phosphatase n=1 Tax=uncultured Microbulbifer sp. TaxID=348147 RepID=UPI0025D770C8|nr:fused response regulator/phosphatase [uncultured Microbulbifer sp.]